MPPRNRRYDAAVIPSAYLRLFRPLDSFPEDERREWERFIVSGGPPRTVAQVTPRGARELGDFGQHAAIHGLADRAERQRPARARDRILRLRILAGIISLREQAPRELIDAYVPEAQVRRAARELARLRRRDPHAAPSILQSPWHVPVRWFLLVDDPERRLREVRPGEFQISYWTPIGHAKRRVEKALAAIRRTDLAPLVPMVRELAQWLSGFAPESVVELDYAEVSALFTWDELDNDHSGHDIQEAIDALTRPGGMAQAADLYQGVANRWAETLNRESLN